MPMIQEFVFRNGHNCELSRHQVTLDRNHDIDLNHCLKADDEFRSIVMMMDVGDSLTIEERWTENGE